MLADISSFRTSFPSQEQLLLELDMYQDIAVARGSTYDTLNKRMDRCQENIETVSDDPLAKKREPIFGVMGLPLSGRLRSS